MVKHLSRTRQTRASSVKEERHIGTQLACGLANFRRIGIDAPELCGADQGGGGIGRSPA